MRIKPAASIFDSLLMRVCDCRLAELRLFRAQCFRVHVFAHVDLQYGLLRLALVVVSVVNQFADDQCRSLLGVFYLFAFQSRMEHDLFRVIFETLTEHVHLAGRLLA